MLKEMEYLGFAIRSPERGVSVFFFQMAEVGLKLYGPFKFEGKINEHEGFLEAPIITGTFADGTQPITLSEFHERTAAGETWNNGDFNIFTKLMFVGQVRLRNKDGEFIVLHELLKENSEELFLTMFSEALGLLAWNFEVIGKKAKRMKKAKALYDENIAPMEQCFSDKDIYRFYEDLIVMMIDESRNVADKPLVDFILEENARLTKQGVPKEKRSAKIARATQKRHEAMEDADLERNAKRGNKEKAAVVRRART